MAPRSIALTEDEDRIVDQLVRSGRFRDADEVVREGLRLVAEDEVDEDFGLSLEELRAAVKEGADAIERGDYVEFADAGEAIAYLEARTADIISGKRRQ